MDTRKNGSVRGFTRKRRIRSPGTDTSSAMAGCAICTIWRRTDLQHITVIGKRPAERNRRKRILRNEIVPDLHIFYKSVLPQDKKILLYAPTFRDDEFSEDASYKFSPKLSFDRLKETLQAAK